MFNSQERSQLLNQLETLMIQLLTFLQNQLPKIDEERNFQIHDSIYQDQQNLNNLSSTIDIARDYFQQLKTFQKVYNDTKEVLLTVSLEEREFKQQLEDQKSKIKSSIYISNVIYQDSDIERAKVEDLTLKLSEFIKNFRSSNEIICIEHNEKAEFIDISKDLNIIDRRACIRCNKEKIRFADFLEQYLMQFFNFKIFSQKQRLDIKKDIQTLINQVGTHKNIENFYIKMDQEFKTRIEIIDDIFGSKKIGIQQLSKMGLDFAQNQPIFNNFQKQFITQLKDNMRLDLVNAQTLLNNQIKSLSFEKIQQETPTQLNIDKQFIQQSSQERQLNIDQLTYTKLSYEEQSKRCQSLCFNKDDKLIATSSHNVIIIWNFSAGKMNYFTELKGHKEEISCLLFDKNSDALISAGGDEDKIINLWAIKNKKWELSKSYNNNGGIKVMLFNKQGDQLIIGTQKSYIKIFNINFQTSTLELFKEFQVDKNQKAIFGLSLNQEQNYLIQCGDDKQLRLISYGQIMECQINKLCTEKGMRVKFIDNSSFVLVQRDGYLIYYKYQWNKFNEIQTLRLSSIIFDYSYTPIHYDSNRKLLIVKHCKTIYFLKLDNEQFQIIKKLEYQYPNLFATISNNGKFLVSWLGKDKEQEFKGDLCNLYQIYELEY